MVIVWRLSSCHRPAPRTSRGGDAAPGAASGTRPHPPTHEAHRPVRGASAGVGRWWGIEGGGGKVPESRGGDTARGRPVGGPGDRAGLPGLR